MSTYGKIAAYALLAVCAILFGIAAKMNPDAKGTNGAFCFASIVAVGFMAARDISRFFAEQAVDFVYSDEILGTKDPEYEKAEEVWQGGDYLEAIRMMRSYYERNPREVHVIIRIAEIYENNLRNYLAAALEYEEVLKKPLPPERWGWRAIHLVNLYNKLNQPDKANTLLYRIASEYSQTPAARKAREKLGMSDPAAAPVVVPEKVRPPAHPAVEAPPPNQNLPPGFRPH